MIRKHKIGEKSFTLLETMVSIGLLIVFMAEAISVQGNAAYFTQYGRDITRATYLGKRVLEQVDYYWNLKPFRDIKFEGSEIPFEDDKDYTYDLNIMDWKLPIFDLMKGSLGGGQAGEGGGAAEAAGGMGDIITQQIEKILGKELFKVAHVKVNWGEGAKKEWVEFTYLLTNQKKLDEILLTQKATYDKLTKGTPAKKNNRARGRNNQGNNPSNPTNPANPGAVPNE